MFRQPDLRNETVRIDCAELGGGEAWQGSAAVRTSGIMIHGEQPMTIPMNKDAEPAGTGKDRKPAASPADDDPCRCKQVSVMTPKQLLGTMLKDLAFWKKEKDKEGT